MHKKFSNIAVFIEFVTSSGLAVFFHWVLHYEEVAYIIFAIGLLLSLATYLLKEEMEKSHDDLMQQYHKAHEITFAIARISDPECQARANELINGMNRTIHLLQQGYIPLEETEFYLEAARNVDCATSQVKTVDPVTTGWDNRGSLRNFYQSNLRAVERGIRFTRIFVINREELEQPDFQKFMVSQLRDGITVRIAYRDELPSNSDISTRDTSNSFDFAIYDDRVVTEVFGQTGKYFGRKTTQPAQLAKFLHFYSLIEHSSNAATLESDKIVVSGETINGEY